MGRFILIASILAGLTTPLAAQSFQSWAAKGDRSKKKDSAAAIAAYTQALRLWKKKDGTRAKARVLTERASLFEKNGETEKAVKDLAAAIVSNPKSSTLHHRRGRLNLELGRAKAAVGDFYKAIALNLDFRDAYHDRARAYELLGDLAFAREDHRTACGLGHKKSCAAAKALRQAAAAAKAKAAARRTREDAYAAPLEPEGPRVVEIKRSVGGKKVKADYDACINEIDSCLEEGGSFGACAARAKACEDAPGKGCCPRACLKLYARIAAQQSEAAAHRAVFTPEHACAK